MLGLPTVEQMMQHHTRALSHVDTPTQSEYVKNRYEVYLKLLNRLIRPYKAVERGQLNPYGASIL